MISSTIGELASEREGISEALTKAGLADGWLFELHATAAGDHPAARYLRVARTCDLYVIIIAAQGSEATEAEYHTAYADNPRKVLPFFVGPLTHATQTLRELIESRHVRVHREDLSNLVPAVVAAVTDQLRSGEFVRPALLEVLDGRLRRAERVVSTALPLAFIPNLSPNPSTRDSASAVSPATSLPARELRVVLEGIGGSGKTYAALAMLRHAASTGRLPVVVQPRSSTANMTELIIGAFDAVRFFPGDALLQELARDGRVAIVIDGIDALSPADRRIFLQDIDEFARRFPRSLVICCVRRLLPDELALFARFTLEPLMDRQIADMFRAANVPQVKTFPPQVADLARWPLWAWALLEVGPSVPTGLLLLQQLLAHRLRVSGAYAPTETELLTAAASAIAFHAWPQPSMSSKDALSTLARWATDSTVSRRFAVPPAGTVIQQLSAAGIVHLTPDVVFAHPLFATYLAALHASASEPMTEAMAEDSEFAVFVAALLDDDRVDEKLALLLHHGPVGQARYLRLVPPARREPGPDSPVAFGAAVKKLTGSAAECIVTDDWTAWRLADVHTAADPDIVRWVAEGDVNFLQGHAFRDRSPVDVATIESLARFKSHVNRHQPAGDRFARLSEDDLKRLRKLPRAELDELILQAVLDWRREWRAQARSLEIWTLPETAIGDGDPEVIARETWPDPKLRIDWDSTAGVTWVPSGEGDAAWNFWRLSTFLDPGRDARIYEELVQRVERALGCSLGSQAWSRPEHVAAWAW
jgi:hypothetical protein